MFKFFVFISLYFLTCLTHFTSFLWRRVGGAPERRKGFHGGFLSDDGERPVTAWREHTHADKAVGRLTPRTDGALNRGLAQWLVRMALTHRRLVRFRQPLPEYWCGNSYLRVAIRPCMPDWCER